MRCWLTLGLVALGLTLGACGEEDDSGDRFPPAAGELTPSSDTPGVPPGASYDLTGSEWDELEDVDRFEAALDYIADTPEECESAEGTAAADPVRDYADVTLGTDYPFNAPMAELLAEGCAAALQGTPGDLAE